MSRKTVSIVCDDEIERAVSAEVERGLALHKGVGKHEFRWVITHIKTGRRVVTFEARNLAQGCMIELAYSADWLNVEDGEDNRVKLLPIIKPIVERWQYIEASVKGMD
jgi:hypothetical protein